MKFIVWCTHKSFLYGYINYYTYIFTVGYKRKEFWTTQVCGDITRKFRDFAERLLLWVESKWNRRYVFRHYGNNSQIYFSWYLNTNWCHAGSNGATAKKRICRWVDLSWTAHVVDTYSTHYHSLEAYPPPHSLRSRYKFTTLQYGNSRSILLLSYFLFAVFLHLPIITFNRLLRLNH